MNVKLNLAQLSRLRLAFHTLPLFHLRTEKLRDSGTQKLSSQNTRNGVPEREQLKTFWAGACGHQNLLAASALGAPLIRRS